MPWAEPLAVAARFSGHDIALLYSGVHEPFSGDLSYLFVRPLETISGDDWATLPALPETSDGLPLWVGYLGYGMREGGTSSAPSPVTLPDFSLTRYAEFYRFNHAQKTIEHFVAQDASNAGVPTTSGKWHDATSKSRAAPHVRPPAISGLTSNFTRASYESVIAKTIEQIHAGNFYQANITRKFYGQFAQEPSSWEIFEALCAASPAPYSAYIRSGKKAILSSSPECFLSIDANGIMTTRPIKGSARRSDDETADIAIRQTLKASDKNHAENLMIVDLMRNDLARVSTPQSVEVVEQSALYSYRTIHHLISTIRAQKIQHISAYEAVRACFPAGSMTGAPKIAAMRWCAASEQVERGLYSGAIGWFGGGNTCDLSVVIRTLIIDGNDFEFQVGGGIVADSTPEDEWRETITKARGILAALGLSEDDLARL
ncbi:MAG: anthranilate synthase component I family protein [Rickettsiales bacterium]|nr:anthranilate synthase component I family protein [Rickettsiales bacterium]